MTNPAVVVIGIAGGTGSGKTTVSRNIMSSLDRDIVAYIDQDSYYKDLSHLPLEERELVNFDHPHAIDNDRLYEDIGKLKQFQAVEKPLYNFVTHTRLPTTMRIDPKPVVIVEGILIYVEKRMIDLFDIKLFVDTDADVRVLRRIKRDLHERGRSLEHVERQYLESVRPMHLEFVEPSKRWADVIIPEGGHNEVAMDMILAKIHSLVKVEK